MVYCVAHINHSGRLRDQNIFDCKLIRQGGLPGLDTYCEFDLQPLNRTYWADLYRASRESNLGHMHRKLEGREM